MSEVVVTVLAMALTLGMVTIDTLDARALAQWWAAQTAGRVVQENDGWFVVVQLPTGPMLAFQKVDQPAGGKARLHLDLVAPDLDAEVARLIGAGASKIADQEMPGFRWTTMADPDGNVFDVSGEAQDVLG